MSPAPTEDIEAGLGEQVASAEPVSGGSINDAWRVELGSGRLVFVKAREGAPPAEFAAEAAGLRWLRDAGVANVPEVLAGDGPWLALEWVERGTLSTAGEEELGRGLARLHAAGAEAHGDLPPGSPDGLLRIGSVELPSTSSAASSASRPGAAWAEVYAEQRLRALIPRARERGALSDDDARAVESVCERIAELAGPPEPPSRLHGDLWGGNLLAGADGEGWLIDPAAYGGHREIDLAMLRLFGGPGGRFYDAYEEEAPLPDGAAERVELWQILPLLVHAVLFGGSYGASAGSAARRYL